LSPNPVSELKKTGTCWLGESHGTASAKKKWGIILHQKRLENTKGGQKVHAINDGGIAIPASKRKNRLNLQAETWKSEGAIKGTRGESQKKNIKKKRKKLSARKWGEGATVGRNSREGGPFWIAKEDPTNPGKTGTLNG